MAGSVSQQGSAMAVLCLFVFMFWNVGASGVDHMYKFPERWDAHIVPQRLQVLQLEELSPRVKRQSGLDSPDDTSTTVADATPDNSNQAGIPANGQSLDNTSIATPTSQSNNNGSSSGSSSTANSDNTNNLDNNNSNGTFLEATSTMSPEERKRMEDANVYHLNHRYYTSTYSSRGFELYWSELATATQHRTLSNGHRVAAVINLKFPFYFYGHKVTNVTVATGGFIYMSHFLHQWLTTTQYIAPLMANFDTSLSSTSSIIYQSTPDKFTVEWKDVMLRDQRSVGKFRFQAVLNRDNSIYFLYKDLPISVPEISSKQHPVRIGMSDAWYNDTFIPDADLMRRTIIEYHRVVVNTTLIQKGSVVVINPLPTCNRLLDCDTCTRHINVSFNCKWCNIIGRCSDGPDWYRQHWNKRGCGDASVEDSDTCSVTTVTTAMPNTTKPATTTSSTSRPPNMSTTTSTPKSSTTTTTTTTSTTTRTPETTTTHTPETTRRVTRPITATPSTPTSTTTEKSSTGDGVRVYCPVSGPLALSQLGTLS